MFRERILRDHVGVIHIWSIGFRKTVRFIVEEDTSFVELCAAKRWHAESFRKNAHVAIDYAEVFQAVTRLNEVFS